MNSSIFVKAVLIFSTVICIFNSQINAQLLLEEHFKYQVGYLTNAYGRNNVSNGAWLSDTANLKFPGSETIKVSEGSLSYYGYESDLLSNMITEQPDSDIYSIEAVYSYFPKQFKGITYFSYLFNLHDTLNLPPQQSQTPLYFLNLMVDSLYGWINQVTIRKGSQSNSMQFLLRDVSAVGAGKLYDKDFAINTTHLVVTAYKFGTNDNDSCFLWINPNPKIQPNPNIAFKVQSGNGVSNISRVALYRTNSVIHPSFSIDAIRVGKTWKDIMGKPPLYYIFQVNGTNPSTTLPDSMDVNVRLRGTVVGFNQQDSGFRFLLHDGTGGITVLNLNNNFGLQLKEKDSVEVRGTITSDKGLVCINADTVILMAENKPMANIVPVSTLNENSENKLVRVNNLRFLTVPTGSTWQNGEYKVRTTLGDTVTIRLLPQSSLINKPVPSTIFFDVTGMAGQQSSSTGAPFKNDGYYIVPRYESDIVQPDTLGRFNILSPEKGNTFTIGGDSTMAINFIWLPVSSRVFSVTPKYTIEIDTITGNFSNPRISLISELSGDNNNKLFSYGVISGLLKLKSGQTYYAKWRIKAKSSSGSFIRYSDSVHTITFVRSKFNSLDEVLNGEGDFRIYPNPASNYFKIESNMQGTHQIRIYNISGKLLQSLTQNSYQAIDISSLQAGLYFLQVQFECGLFTTKLLVEH